MKKFKHIQFYTLTVLLMLFAGNVWGQYEGTGTFIKITSIIDLTDGYYVIAEANDEYAMNNSHNGTYLDRTAISPSAGELTDPAASIVWRIETNGGGRSIYNEEIEKYVSYTGSGNDVQIVDAVTADNQRWTIAFDNDVFVFTNLAVTDRMLQYNPSSPRFVCYTSNQRKFNLYKLEESANDPLINVNPLALTGFNYTVGDGPSAEQSFTVEGNNLVDNITLTPPANYEISTGTEGSFVPANPITLTPNAGTVAETTIFVRLKAGLAVGTYDDEEITATSTDAQTEVVTCSGEVTIFIQPAISIDDYEFSYSQDFNTLANSGTGNTWADGDIPGWMWQGNSARDPNQYGYIANAGTSNTAAGHSYGAVEDNDRAMGALSSSGHDIYIGVKFKNDTGEPIELSEILISYTGEQWRRNTGAESLVFSYKISASNISDITTGAWTTNTNLTFAALHIGTAGALDGNDNNNRHLFVNIPLETVTKTSLLPGQYLALRWFKTGTNSTGLAVDDFLFTIAEQSIEEPSNHATNFTATSNSTTAITVTWTDADPAPDGYLIKGSDENFAAIEDPVDGTPEEDDELIQNVSAGVELHQFTGLIPSTTYYFKIFPYNGSGHTINYKTDDVPEIYYSTLDIASYSWTGADNASWQDASNWNPNRTVPDATDIVQFNGGSPLTITDVPDQTIAQLMVSNNTAITLQASAAATLGITGDTGDSFVVESGSQLNISGANALQLSLSAGANGSISGTMTFSEGGHRLLSPDASGITFNSGSQFTSGAGFSGNPFGNSNSGSAIFANGSTFIYNAGSNPFAISNAVTIFQTGSNYVHQASSPPAFSGRTYANFEYNNAGSSTPSGGSAVSIDNLKISQGTFNFNVTATPGHSINGNIDVSPGATLNFNPTDAGTVNLSGSDIQTISVGGTINANTNSTISIDNSLGVVLDGGAIFNNLTISEDAYLTIGSNSSLKVTGTLINNNNAKSEYGLLIESDDTGTGSLIHNTPGVQATVEYYMPDSEGTWPTKDKSTDWYWISAPVLGQNIEDFLDAYTGQYDLYRWDESSALWRNHKAGNFTDTEFVSGTGYLTAFQDEHTHKFNGELTIADKVWTNLTHTPAAYHESDIAAGWHLIGNPYASGIVFSTEAGDGQWMQTNVELTPQFWNSTTETYDAAIADEWIPSATAFFVRVTEGANTLTIPAAARKHAVNEDKNQSIANYIILAAKPVDSQLMQRSYLRIEPDTDELFDNRYDSRFRPGNAPIFYSFRDQHKLLVNAVPAIHHDLSIPFVFEKIESADEYSINLERSIEGVSLYLLDRKINKEHLLTADNAYFFISEAGDAPHRFDLRFAPLDDDDFVDITQPGQHDEIRIWHHDNILHVVNPDTDLNLNLYDISGRRLQNHHVTAGMHRIELSLPPGVYIVETSGSKQQETLKIIIQ